MILTLDMGSSLYVLNQTAALLAGLTYPEVSSKVYHNSFCQLGSSVSLPWVKYFEAFYLHVVCGFLYSSNLSKIGVFLTTLQFVHLFCVSVQVYPAVVLVGA